jgi:hypothetical protein
MAEQIGIVKQNMQAWDPELGTLVNKQVPICHRPRVVNIPVLRNLSNISQAETPIVQQ